jgi:CrcB protein
MDQPSASSGPPDIRDEATAVDIGERLRLSPWHHLARLTHRAEVMVGAGAIIGVIGRFVIGNLAKANLPGPFPIGTLMINLMGCLIIGMMQTLFLEFVAVRREAQLFVSVGFCGGLTTFSTFSVETVQLLQEGHAWQACWYQALSLAGGLIAVLLGITAAHVAHRQLEQWHGRGT